MLRCSQFYILRKKLFSLMPFRRATLELFVISCLRSRLTTASSPGPVRSLLCSWTGIRLGSVLSRRSCLRSYFWRCFLVIAVSGSVRKSARSWGLDGCMNRVKGGYCRGPGKVLRNCEAYMKDLPRPLRRQRRQISSPRQPDPTASLGMRRLPLRERWVSL